MVRLAVVPFLACLLFQGGGSGLITFTKESEGKLPAGWREESTGNGKGSVWRVLADGTAPSGKGFVLAQTAQSPGSLFNLCVYQNVQVKDIELTVHFKAH